MAISRRHESDNLIQGAGDRTAFGGRNIDVIRKGKLHKLDYRNDDARNFVLQLGDVINVRQRGMGELNRGG